jgi:ribonuclease G
LAFLKRLWKELSEKVDESKVPALIHEDLDLILKSTRDLLRPDFDALYVDDDVEFERISAFVKTFMPRCTPLIKRYTEKSPLFTRYGVEHEISRAIEPKVWLKSGGSIVIERTEALTAIDVNTGRYVGKSNLEETILKINLEAVKEVAYQLRLRNIGGIIVIDFIDMESEAHRATVQEAMETALSHDRIRTNVLPMSSLGLIEMTRKRVGESLTQMLTENCNYCGSRGWTLSRSEIARQVLNKVIDTLSSQRKISNVAIDAHPKIVEALYEDYREDLDAIKVEYGAKLAICEKDSQYFEQFTVKGS